MASKSKKRSAEPPAPTYHQPKRLKLNPPTTGVQNLDQRYIESQKEATKALHSFIKTASDHHSQIQDHVVHNSLFCHEDAKDYSTATKNGKLACYCREVARCFQKYGPRSDFHLGGSGVGMGVNLSPGTSTQMIWQGLLEELMDADEESWCLMYRKHYEFHGDNEKLKVAMAQCYKQIKLDIQAKLDRAAQQALKATERQQRRSQTKEKSEKRKRSETPEDWVPYRERRMLDQELDFQIQESCRLAMEREEQVAEEREKSLSESPVGKRVRRTPLRYSTES